MEYFLIRYDSRVVNYECKMFIRLATGTLNRQRSHKYLSSDTNASRRFFVLKQNLAKFRFGLAKSAANKKRE